VVLRNFAPKEREKDMRPFAKRVVVRLFLANVVAYVALLALIAFVTSVRP